MLTDVEKISPCLPGVWLQEVEGEEYLGVVKVKAGPITTSYEGVARYLLLDADERKAVLKAEGREIHGQGKGTAVVTATLSPSAQGTKVQVVTVLSIDGRLAHLSAGVLAAVSRNLIAEFAENLEMTVVAATRSVSPSAIAEAEASETDETPAEAAPETGTEVPSDPASPVAEPDNAQIHLSTAEPEAQEPLMRRLAPYLTVAGLVLIARIVVYSLRRRPR